jgi:hypothetical protein
MHGTASVSPPAGRPRRWRVRREAAPPDMVRGSVPTGAWTPHGPAPRGRRAAGRGHFRGWTLIRSADTERTPEEAPGSHVFRAFRVGGGESLSLRHTSAMISVLSCALPCVLTGRWTQEAGTIIRTVVGCLDGQITAPNLPYPFGRYPQGKIVFSTIIKRWYLAVLKTATLTLLAPRRSRATAR